MLFENLRPLYFTLDETTFWLAGRAVQIVEWDRTHQYCGRCGRTTIDQTLDRAKICPNCGLTNYPRLAPAVIVRVQRSTPTGPEVLLARAQRFPTSMFSVLAGFVEPGETLEECVQREILEEVGLSVKNVAYFGSQPWPFPHSLMIAFTADYDQGEIVVEPNEIAEAAWFASGALPNIPPPPSIANRLITTWLGSFSNPT
jgi:NAD+ diphosphatase